MVGAPPGKPARSARGSRRPSRPRTLLSPRAAPVMPPPAVLHWVWGKYPAATKPSGAPRRSLRSLAGHDSAGTGKAKWERCSKSGEFRKPLLGRDKGLLKQKGRVGPNHTLYCLLSKIQIVNNKIMNVRGIGRAPLRFPRGAGGAPLATRSLPAPYASRPSATRASQGRS